MCVFIKIRFNVFYAVMKRVPPKIPPQISFLSRRDLMLTFCKPNTSVLYNILVKFIFSFFLFLLLLLFLFLLLLFCFFCFLFLFLFPGISSRFLTGDCKFYVYTCKCLIWRKKRVPVFTNLKRPMYLTFN